MTALLKVLSQEERRHKAAGYFDWIRRRDGEPDMARHTLSAREEYFAQMDASPVRWDGHIPFGQYAKACKARSRKDLLQTPEVVLWAAAMTCVNSAEAYAIRLALSRRTWTDLSDVMTWIELEELYHTRLLVDTLYAVGVDAIRVEPEGFLRSFLDLAAIAGPGISDILAFIGEIVGVVLFTSLRRKGRELFNGSRAVCARIQAHLGEILVDEAGHVSSLRTRISPLRMPLVRVIYTYAATKIIDSHPVYAALFGRDELIRSVHSFTWDMFPEDIRAQAFLA